MPFKFKLSKRLALLKGSLVIAGAALALACERTDLSAPEALPSPDTQVVFPLSGTTVLASAHDGNLPQNTLDNNLATRWSAYGDGQWIRYDLGALRAVDRLDVAWFQGNAWASAFDIEVSPDAVTWTRVFAGRSSGLTIQRERYEFPAASARYLRIVGHGQWSGTTPLSLWNSITEIAIYEAAVPVMSVAASAHDGNLPQNTLDHTLATRWSAYGDGQWIQYDLGALKAVGRVEIAWFRGNAWASAFDIDVSPDAVTWTRVFAGRSSGLTIQSERYEFPTAAGRYLRIVGHGQWSGTTPLSLWTSITEVAIYGSAAATPPPPPPPPPAPAAVATVAVSPASASVPLGATLQLSAVVKDANGMLLSGRSITWTSSTPAVATVSASGLVTGLTLGSATITATSEGKSGTAVLTVPSAGAGAGPSPGPTSLIIFQDGFESGNLSLWEQIPANGRYSVTANAARVKSGARAMQTLYTPTNGYGMITRWFMPGYDEVYVRFYVMFQEGFQNMRGDGNGMHFFVLTGNRIDNRSSASGKAGVRPNGTDFFYAGLDPEYIQRDPTLRPFGYYTYWPDMPSTYGTVRTQSSPKTALIGGQWQEVVMHIKLNTPGQYNGSQTVWIDGVKKLDQQNMRWRTTTDLRVNQIRFDNYMPGGLKTQYIWVDDVTVWRP